jgi:hypothetical protein
LPLAVEIYPRLFAGRVHKSNPAERRAHLEVSFPHLAPDLRLAAESTDDAFDAAISALAMARCADDLADLPVVDADPYNVEGVIWHPAWRLSQPTARAD